MPRARATTALVTLAALAAAPGCNRDAVKVTTYHFERCGAVDFACLCSDERGVESPAPMERCADAEDDANEDCFPVAFVVQTNRDELGIVDLGAEQLVDSDVRVPFNTFPQTGRSPSDVAVTRDGELVLVTHFAEDYVAVLRTRDCFGPELPEARTIALGGPSSSIAVSTDGATAWVTLPRDGAIAVIDLADLSAAPVVRPFPAGVPARDAGGEEGEAEAEPDAATDGSEAEPEEGEEGEEGAETQEADAGEAEVGTADADVVEIDGDGGEAPPPEPFFPLHVTRVQAAEGERLVVSGDGSGGVRVLDPAALAADGVEAALVAALLPGVPVSRSAVTPDGRFVYAIDRDEGTVHVADAATGEEVDTSGGNPLASHGAIKLAGWARDLVILDLAFEGDSDATAFDGVFAFVAASDGTMYVVDIEDRACAAEFPATADVNCPAHVARNVTDDASSYPAWRGVPLLYVDERQLQFTDLPPPDYPLFDRFETSDMNGNPTYGISFYPADPWEGRGELYPDIRRPVSQTWQVQYEGSIPFTAGIGGNVDDGGVLSDAGIPFCYVGVRGADAATGYPGDVLVLEDAPSPIGETADCTAWEAAGEEEGIEYRIVEARQWELRLAALGAPLPTEECFPFAVEYHVRASGSWIVTGAATGYLTDWTVDDEGRCADPLPPCAAWGEEGCTLLAGRAYEGKPFVNPFFKFLLLPGTRPTPSKATWVVTAASGFTPLQFGAARLPSAIRYLPWNRSLYVSDGATEGLVEIDVERWGISNKYF